MDPPDGLGNRGSIPSRVVFPEGGGGGGEFYGPKSETNLGQFPNSQASTFFGGGSYNFSSNLKAQPLISLRLNGEVRVGAVKFEF